jgi:FixJ family two-component response regulator
MPNMDGIEFRSHVQDRWPRVARIILTAYPDPELAVRAAKEPGVGLFIAKPFDPQYVGDLLQVFARRKD